MWEFNWDRQLGLDFRLCPEDLWNPLSEGDFWYQRQGAKGELLIFPLGIFPSQSWFVPGNAVAAVVPDWLKWEPREIRWLGG